MVCCLLLAGCEREKQPGDPKAKPKSAIAPARKNEIESSSATLRQAIDVGDERSLSIFRRYLLGDPSERIWAPLGLGLHCEKTNRHQTVELLTSAMATWVSSPPPLTSEEAQIAAWAIGSCATDSSERVLRSWLSPDPSAQLGQLVRAAAWGLGAYADSQGHLSERTQSALVNAAAREKDAQILWALGRIDRISEAVGAHLLEVTGELLTQDPPKGRRAALFALGRAGPSAVSPLSQVLLSSKFSASERAAAAQALANLGQAGQKGLDETVDILLSRGLPSKVDDPRFIALKAALLGLESAEQSRKAFFLLRSLNLPDSANKERAALRRRLLWLRCRAADLYARDNPSDAALLSCDPEHGREQKLAQLRVLDRIRLERDNLKIYAGLLKDEDVVVAQAALRMTANHPELANSDEYLLAALQSPVPGLKTVAGQIIAAYPARAFSADDTAPSDSIVAALAQILKNHSLPLETRGAALAAAGASQALTLKPAVEELCKSSESPLWAPAQSALALLGSPQAQCKGEKKTLQKSAPKGKEVELIAETDIGTLRLLVQPEDAPQTAAHFLQRVDAGFYDGTVIFGAREGFALQLGDKNGDGYEDELAPGLPHEVSPTAFSALSFGMASSAPGAQDTQLFVLVADAPQLTASRVRLGTVSGPWDQLVVGDVIQTIRRAQQP
jgi:cyclophilin family peptidyl-prolyl cis-trans isomerase